MCLGIPGRIVEFDVGHEHLANVDVAGVVRRINVGLLEDDPAEIGDYVLIHVGFAMSKIDEDEARRAMEGLKMMGVGIDDELEQFMGSQVE